MCTFILVRFIRYSFFQMHFLNLYASYSLKPYNNANVFHKKIHMHIFFHKILDKTTTIYKINRPLVYVKITLNHCKKIKYTSLYNNKCPNLKTYNLLSLTSHSTKTYEIS